MSRSSRILLVALLALSAACAPPPADIDVHTASIRDLQTAMDEGRITAETIVSRSLHQIAYFDGRHRATLAVNRQALDIARRLDHERAAGRVRGPLHGIPVGVKDIVNTVAMPTTGGALAFKDHIPPYRATIVDKLHAAGAIIIAKTTNTELANWVATGMPGNYNGLRGQAINPLGEALSPGGSSSGIGNVLGMWTVTVGTETSGSILSPANQTGLVGIKPTLGRISRHGIMPITADQDTAGPMARTVEDAAILLGVLEGVDPNDPATGRCEPPPENDYTQFLIDDALVGARLGVPRAYFYDDLEPERLDAMERAFDLMRAAGAIVMDVEIPSIEDGSFRAWLVCYGEDDAKGEDEDCSVVLKYGMKRDFNRYLESLGETAPVKTLTELREFNLAHADDGAIKYGQTQLDISDEMDVGADRVRYEADRAKDLDITATRGIDAALEAHDLDALVFPGAKGANFAARPGYPSVMVPFGTGDGPLGVTFTGTACAEPGLIALAYAFEQARPSKPAVENDTEH